VGRRRNGPLLSTRDDDEKNGNRRKKLVGKEKNKCRHRNFPFPSLGRGGGSYWKNAYGILRMNYDVGPTSNYDVGTTSLST